MSNREASTITGCGTAAATIALLNVGSDQFRPTPLGFLRSRAQGTTLQVDSFEYGYSLNRITIGTRMVSIFAGLGRNLTGGGACLKTLLINVRKNGEKIPSAGVLFEANMVSNFGQSKFGLRPTHMSQEESLDYSLCDNIGQDLITILASNADMHGCRINPRKFLEFSGSGQLDSFLMDLLSEGRAVALKRYDCNSVELYADLDFEIGLGINPEEVDSNSIASMQAIEKFVEREHEFEQYNNVTALRSLLLAVGSHSCNKELHELPPGLLDQLVSGPLYFHRPSREGKYFHFVRRAFDPLAEYHPEIWLDQPAVYFRPALRGHDCSPRNTYRNEGVRMLGTFIVAPISQDMIFHDLEKFQRMSWKRFMLKEHEYHMKYIHV